MGNIKVLGSQTAESCKTQCNSNKNCQAVEFATDRDAEGIPAYGSGTCLFQSLTTGGKPTAPRFKNLDLYIKDCSSAGRARAKASKDEAKDRQKAAKDAADDKKDAAKDKAKDKKDAAKDAAKDAKDAADDRKDAAEDKAKDKKDAAKDKAKD